MTTSTPKKGYDAWVGSGNIHKNHGSDSWLQVQSGITRTLLWLPMPDRMAGRTIASATLTGHAHGTVNAQTLSVQAVTAQWTASTVTWSNQPAVSGPIATLTLGSSVTDGSELVWDVTSLVQAIANGTTKNYGWRIFNNYATNISKLAAFNSGVSSWTLEVQFSEDPDAPSALSPNGTVVAAAKPVVTFDFSEYGADQSDLAAVRVEVDTNGDGTVDWNSGWVTSVTPSMDLAAKGMTGTIAAGSTVKWRAYVQDANGNQSLASDWATYTYQPLNTLTMNSPAAGVLYDPTSEVIATNSGPANLAAWLIQVTDATDRTAVRYDSGKTKATDPTQIALELPLKNDDGSRIFTDDQSYQIHVRAWDTLERQATPGLATHADLWTTVLFNDDGALSQVTTFTAAQTGTTPWVQLSWTDAAAPDAYDVTRDEVHIARLDPADVTTGASSYAWSDQGAAPAVSHTYKLRRITTGTGRSPAKSATITTNPEGAWLLRDNGDYVVLDGTDGVGSLQILERRLTYTPINLPYGVDILTQYEGYSSAQPLVFSVEDDEDQTLTHAQNILNAIKQNSTETVQFIAATISKPVRITDLEVVPDPDYRGDMNRHIVRFNIKQVGDFDYKVG